MANTANSTAESEGYKITQFRCRLVRERSLRVASSRILNAYQAAEVFYRLLAQLPHEEMWVLFLNARNDVIGSTKLAQGGLHGCAVTSCDVFRAAIVANASAVILAHNHPSGDPNPSPEDMAMTRAVIDAGKLIGIPLVDHLVVCPERKTFRSIVGRADF